MDLPKEIVEHIFSFLDAKLLFQIIPLVSKEWEMICNSASLWKPIISRHFSIEQTHHLDVSYSENMTWKRLYREIYIATQSALIYFPFNEGHGLPKSFHLNRHDQQDLYSIFPTPQGRSISWDDLWVSTITSDLQRSDVESEIDVPHQQYCIQFKSKRRDSLLITLKDKYTISSSFSIFMKVKFQSFPSHQQNFFSIWCKNFNRVVGEIHEGGSLGFYTPQARAKDLCTLTLSANKWISLCITFHKGIVEIFINGIKTAHQEIDCGGDFSMRLEDDDEELTQNFYLGSDRHHCYWTDCQMSTVLLYNHCISAETIQTLRNL